MANAVQIPLGRARGPSIIQVGEKHDPAGRWAFRRAVAAAPDRSAAVQPDQRES